MVQIAYPHPLTAANFGAPPTQERPPSPFDLLAQNFGQGIGEGLHGQVKKQLQQSVVDKALKNFGKDVPLDEQYKSFAALPEDVQKQIGPYLDFQTKQQEAQGKSAQELNKLKQEYALKQELEKTKAQYKPAKGAAGVLDKRKAETIANIIEDVPKIEESKATLNRLDELRHNLEGVGGYAKALFGSEDAAEFNALGLASIDPILKIFNPRGALPQQKIEMIKALYAPQASDTQRTIVGKLNALRSFADAAEKRATRLASLMDQYGEDIPLQEFLKFEKESEATLNQLNKKAAKDLGPVPRGYKRLTNMQTGEILDVPIGSVKDAKADGFE